MDHDTVVKGTGATPSRVMMRGKDGCYQMSSGQSTANSELHLKQ